MATRSYTTGGLLAAAGAAAAWAVGIILIKLTTSPFLVASFYRHAFALPFLLAAWAISRERSLPIRSAGIGGLLFAVHQIMHFGSLRYATAAVVTILFALQPIVVAAAGRRVTGETATRRFYTWALIAAGGCALLVYASAGLPGTNLLGVLLAIGNLLSFSAYYLATKRARERVGTASWLLVMTTVSGLCIGAIVIGTGESFTAPSGSEWAVLAAIGIIPGTLGHAMITWAHPRIHAAASSAVILGVPVLATAAAAVFLDEPFGPLHVAGGVVALAAAAMALRHLPPPAPVKAAESYGELAT